MLGIYICHCSFKKEIPMQSFGNFTLIEDYVESILKYVRRGARAAHIFQPNYANDPNYIMKSTQQHLLHFSEQIIKVEEIKMAHLKDGFIPRKLNQWLNKATDLKCQVTDALKEQQNSNKLKGMCDEIFDKMKDCPIEDVNDKPIAFIAPMHETEDGILPSEDDVQAQDVEKDVAASDKVREHTITIEGLVSFLEESYGARKLTLRKKYTLTPENMGSETLEGESSSHVHDAIILEFLPKDSSSPYISQVQDENKLKTTEEGDAPKGVLLRRSNEPVLKLEDGARRRHGKMPIGETDSSSVSPYSADIILSENNPFDTRVEAGKHHDETSVTSSTQTDGSTGESGSGMVVQILPTTKMSEHVDLRLQIFNMPSSQAAFNLNNDFGLRPEMDVYLFSAMKKAAELDVDSHQQPSRLPQNLIVNISGSRSKEMMPAAEEWRQAGVVNLIEKNIRLLSEEPHCPNLEILFLQRNNRLTHIHSSFFNQMPALYFLDLSDTRIKVLPSSLFELTNLQVLLLRSCLCLDSLPAEIKNLKNLEVLDLLETDLSDLPKEISELKRLRYLQLSFYQVSPGAIFKLQALQGLSIVVHPNDQQWINIVGDIIRQVGELKMLSYLQFYFPSVEALKNLSDVVKLSGEEQRLRSFKFLVGDNIRRIISRVPHEVESKYEQYDRCLRFVNGNEVPEDMKNILNAVTAFYLDHHIEIESLSDFNISNFEGLKFCVLRECPNIQVMVKAERRTESAFPNLEYLGLHYLWKLERIWEDPVPTGSYQALKYLMVSTCGKLEYIASHAILKCLFNLETFIIEDCESLKSIVKEDEMVKHDAPLLPRLKELVLRHLPELVALGRGLFYSQKITSIHFCPKLILSPEA